MSDDIRVVKSQALTADEIASLDGAALLEPDFLDGAIIGVAQNQKGESVAVYEYEKVVELYATFEFGSADTDGGQDPYDIAVEWVDYNTLRALPYAGERAPRVVVDAEDCYEDDADMVYEIKGKRYIDA